MITIVIETPYLDKDTEWGVSFTSHNPELEDYVACATAGDAFKLQEILERAEFVISEGGRKEP